MAQLRQDYDHFAARDAEVLVVGPDDHAAFKRYWEKEQLTYVGLADPDHTVADQYGQQVKLLKLGRMPALVIVDQQGSAHYAHFGQSMRDIPQNTDVLAILDELNTGDTP